MNSIEPRKRRYVKCYGFLSFAKNIGKNLGNKYGQKLRRSATDALKTASKRAIQKTAEATGDLVGKRTADKITTISKNQQKSCEMMSCSRINDITKYQKKDIISTRKTTNY